MRITLASVFVNDPEQALRFYCDVLGFQEKVHIKEIGWITVVSADDPDGTQLLLEPNGNPVAAAYQRGLVEQGIPATSFAVDDVRAECERLKALGVRIVAGPTDSPWAVTAIFDDTCGNLIQIHEARPAS
jgi:catechol 2,3-dioxygenase-like lactoylglutathione lyase family enzyme